VLTFSIDMTVLFANTPNQNAVFTLAEARQFLPDFTHYLFILVHEEKSSVGASKSQVLTVLSETQRANYVTLSTVGLPLVGWYRYYVYGQNSAVNLNPESPSVVGIVEQGWLVLTDSTQYYEVPSITLSNDIINNPQ